MHSSASIPVFGQIETHPYGSMKISSSSIAIHRVLRVLVLITVSAQAWQPETLYRFQTDQGHPVARLRQDTNGNLYGTTAAGGRYGFGTIFQVTTNGILKTLTDFDGINGRGELRQPGLVLGSDGNFYGTSYHGGRDDNGTAFQMTPSGELTVLVEFTGTNGSGPNELVLGSDGNFYGTTMFGGSSNLGTVFRLTTNGVLSILGSFTQQNYRNGAYPAAGLVLGRDGNLYGTTSWGGDYGSGTVFQITPDGVFTKLADFDHMNGAIPEANLVQGNDGNFYGTTKSGGSRDYGTVFRVTTNGVLTSLVSLTFTTSWTPQAGLILGNDGNFYGTARDGGTLNSGGVAFKLTPTKILTVLHNFDRTPGSLDGNQPYAGLIQASDGNFRGVASAGGTNAAGTLYEITATGTYSTLYNFVPATGSLPFATLRQHTNGKIYGEATAGGAAGHGALFDERQSPAGD